MLEHSPTHRHYDAATATSGMLRHILPGKDSLGLLGYPAVVWENRFLVANFFRRELLGRFRGSVLGVGWVLVQPIFMFVVYYTVFGLLIGNWKWGQAPDPNFAFYLFTGMITFQSLSEATTNSCTVVVANGNLVKKVAFPSEVLPVDCVLVSQVVYLVAAMVSLLAWLGCAIAASYFVGFPPVVAFNPGWMLLTLPLVLIVQFTMALGIGMFLANIYVFSRDVKHLWGIITTAWMFMTPIFWSTQMLEDKLGGAAQWMFTLNPAFSLVQASRISLGATDYIEPGSMSFVFGDFWSHIGIASLWAIFFLVLGYGFFLSRRHRYADLV